jgi:hypothetical protein
MEKEFVPYELSVKLKEFGFNEPCWGYYHVNEGYSIGYAFCYSDAESQPEIGCLAPTFSQAFRWFREKYEIDVFYWRNSLTDKYRIIEIKIRNKEISLEEKFENKEYKTYEEAELACLDKLIELVKQKHN